MKKPTPFGKYFLLERINVGGMAEVFRAKAFGVEGFERLVAVKRILPNIAEDKEFIRMFIEEAKLSVQLNHANIAQIFDLGVVDGAYYIALEHVHGRDLRGIFDRCRAMGEAMPVAQACFVVMKVCEGLDYAHNKRDQGGRELSLVHRDVSPQNVLVSFEGEVKLIDFGIAKAAGKGSKTQAGILKGKFGYMSPEQVRGLPVDRRSDVFSCGIVLYELLTGERLFVGESDFSTLEKVRNVEILPPSTYNRKIPDELERIVLKALAKDTDERYQNAIDLHDELQAFVYTAGEFYSRKDLAGWMKKTFGKEIEEETAKLESYRQLKPPPAEAPARPAPARSIPPQAPIHTPPPQRRSTQAMQAASGTKPPPPPSARMSQAMPAVAPPAPPTTSLKAQKPPRTEDSGDLSWDDDELETQIYDNPEDDPKNKVPGRTSKPLPLQAPVSQPAMAAHGSAELTPPPGAAPGPDLSSLVSQTAKGWDGGPNGLPHPAGATLNGVGAATAATGHERAPLKFPTGSNKVVAPEPPASYVANSTASLEPSGMPVLFDSDARDLSPSGRLQPPPQAPPPSTMFPAMPASEPPAMWSEQAPSWSDPMASFGQGITRRKDSKRGILMIAIGGAVIAALAVVLVIMLSNRGKDTPKTAADDTVKAGDKTADTNPTSDKDKDKIPDSSGPGPIKTSAADQNTGFDLYITPAGVTQWKLDGESHTEKLPQRIKGITPGKHTVVIDPPAGFMGQNQVIEVEAGKIARIELTLAPIQGIQGTFESNPPGATISLIVDGKREMLGLAPQTKVPLDPRNQYQVLFEKQGYVSVNKPVTFSGQLEERIVVNLEKATDVKVGEGSSSTKPDPTKPDPTKIKPDPTKPDPTKPDPTKIKPDPTKPDPTKPDPTKPDPTKPDPTKPDPTKPDPTKPDPTKPDPTKKDQKGQLLVQAKPPCEIYVDGASTGLHTPQKLTLPVGPHRITLINNEFGIKETANVNITVEIPARMNKDWSDRLPKAPATP